MPGDSMKLLNGFDAVACFAMRLLLVGELSLRWRLPWWFGVSAVLCAAWFNPQFVNVSPIYSSAAGVMEPRTFALVRRPGRCLTFRRETAFHSFRSHLVSARADRAGPDAEVLHLRHDRQVAGEHVLPGGAIRRGGCRA